jgi:hypothetical protein
VPPKPQPELAQRQASCVGELKSALRSLANSRDFERKSADLNVEPSGPIKRDDNMRPQPDVDGTTLAPFLDAFVEMIVEDLLRHPPESKP